jgi:hypothetical protein
LDEFLVTHQATLIAKPVEEPVDVSKSLEKEGLVVVESDGTSMSENI